MSAYLFGPPSDKPGDKAATALAAANCMRPLIDQSIRNAKRTADRSKTIVARLVDMQERGAGDPSDAMIRAELFGMTSGMWPGTDHFLKSDQVRIERPYDLGTARRQWASPFRLSDRSTRPNRDRRDLARRRLRWSGTTSTRAPCHRD